MGREAEAVAVQRDEPIPYASPAPLTRYPQSGFGIASFVLAMPALLAGTLLLPLIMWFRGNGGAVPVGYRWLGVVVYVLSYGMYVFAPLATVSLALGVAGVAQARQRRHLAAAALVMNSVVAILWIMVASS